MEFGGKVVNQTNAFFVSELGKYLILKFSFPARSPASVRYLAICSTVDSLVSPENLVNFGTLVPLGVARSRNMNNRVATNIFIPKTERNIRKPKIRKGKVL